MAVPTAITDLSETAASNSPAGSTSINSEGIDNHLRAGYAFIAELYADKANLASPSFTGTVTAASGSAASPALVAKQAGVIPTTTSGTQLVISSSAGNTSYYTRAAILGGSATGGCFIDFGDETAQGGGGFLSYTHFDDTIALGTATASRVTVNATATQPVTSNAYTLGGASNLWSTVYAATGTINTSDARLKTNVADSVLGLDFINSLRPVSYRWIVGGKTLVSENDKHTERVESEQAGTRTHWGFLAQEVKAAVDVAGVDFGGWVLTDANDATSTQALRYEELIAPLVKAVQELTARVAALEGA